MLSIDGVTIITTIFIILTLVLLILLAVLLKELKKKDKKIDKLSKKVKEMKEDTNSREAFRVNFFIKKCAYSILEIANQTSIDNSWKEGEIRDLSFKGMKLISDFDLPVKKRVKLKIKFNLGDEDFTLVGIIVRQEIYKDEPQMIYGIQFMNDTQNQKALFKVLNKVEIENRELER